MKSLADSLLPLLRFGPLYSMVREVGNERPVRHRFIVLRRIFSGWLSPPKPLQPARPIIVPLGELANLSSPVLRCLQVVLYGSWSDSTSPYTYGSPEWHRHNVARRFQTCDLRGGRGAMDRHIHGASSAVYVYSFDGGLVMIESDGFLFIVSLRLGDIETANRLEAESCDREAVHFASLRQQESWLVARSERVMMTMSAAAPSRWQGHRWRLDESQAKAISPPHRVSVQRHAPPVLIP